MKYIVFDIGGVLVEDIWEKVFFKYIKKKYNISNDERLYSVGVDLWNKYATLDSSDPKRLEVNYWNDVINALRINATPKEFIEITDKYIVPIKKMDKILHDLNGAGYEIVILSNTTCFWFERIKTKLKLDSFVKEHNFILSCKVGQIKEKSNQMFEELIKVTNKDIFLYIDDRVINIEKALQLDIPTLLYPRASSYGYIYLKKIFKKISSNHIFKLS